MDHSDGLELPFQLQSRSEAWKDLHLPAGIRDSRRRIPGGLRAISVGSERTRTRVTDSPALQPCALPRVGGPGAVRPEFSDAMMRACAREPANASPRFIQLPSALGRISCMSSCTNTGATVRFILFGLKIPLTLLSARRKKTCNSRRSRSNENRDSTAVCRRRLDGPHEQSQRLLGGFRTNHDRCRRLARHSPQELD